MQVTLVVGEANNIDTDRDRFKKEADNFTQRLINEFGFSREDFAILTGGLQDTVKSQLETLFLEKSEEDALLCYIGHGAENGWCLSGYKDKEIVAYEDLRLLLVLHHGNLIFLNDCCYALAAEEAVSPHFGDYLLIGAMPADQFGSAPNFLNRVLNCWRRQRHFKDEVSITSGFLEYDNVKLWTGNENLNDLMCSRCPQTLKPLDYLNREANP